MVVVIRFQDGASFGTGSRSVFGMGSRMGSKVGSDFEFLVGVGVGLGFGTGVMVGEGVEVGFRDQNRDRGLILRQ
ncbi:hypothetical protein TIFTF001_037915 [Ficus carica]|uniref:Glycine-rich protein n=1 Tax=Ficus carica TaxID=3494 RepID=A0AA88EHQ0_FICCA|nr:hypothetical protein TIFTF001_037915 [Ficus carica]